MLQFRLFSALLTASALAGCASIHGAEPLITPDGAYSDSTKHSSRPEPDGTTYKDVSPSDATQFATLYQASSLDTSNKGKAENMMIAGLALVRSNCGYYFTSTGNTQKWIFVAQDTVGAAGTVATGVMAALGAGTPSIAWVGLATGTAYSGINIYTKNFLFAAENIDSVRTAVMKQLDQDRVTILAAWDKAPPVTPVNDYTYYTAKQTVLDEQNICTDAHILTIVHAALAASDPPATPSLIPPAANPAAK